MKKILVTFLLAITSVFAVCSFSACNAGGGAGGLQFNKKYIFSSRIHDEAEMQTYYLFRSDGTGEYRYYYSESYSGLISDYVITFKYTYADEDKTAVVCFYDSIEYGKKHNASEIGDDFLQLLTVAENVVCYAGSYGYSIYVNEDYVKNLSNFEAK